MPYLKRYKICGEGSETLLFGAGKFTILAKREDGYQKKLDSLQKGLDNYFLKNFFGPNGFILSVVLTDVDLDQLGRDMQFNNNSKKFGFIEL